MSQFIAWYFAEVVFDKAMVIESWSTGLFVDVQTVFNHSILSSFKVGCGAEFDLVEFGGADSVGRLEGDRDGGSVFRTVGDLARR